MAVSYSQTQEDLIIAECFDKPGTLLSVGENDGETFSNARLLIERGWTAHLVEPSLAFRKMRDLYADNENVYCYNFGLSAQSGIRPFHEASDSLLSSLSKSQANMWGHVVSKERQVNFFTFQEFWNSIGKPKFDFISIDAEGEDWAILQQIDLNEVGCKVLCVESGNFPELPSIYIDYCAKFGLLEIHRNAENMIFSR